MHKSAPTGSCVIHLSRWNHARQRLRNITAPAALRLYHHGGRLFAFRGVTIENAVNSRQRRSVQHSRRDAPVAARKDKESYSVFNSILVHTSRLPLALAAFNCRCTGSGYSFPGGRSEGRE